MIFKEQDKKQLKLLSLNEQLHVVDQCQRAEKIIDALSEKQLRVACKELAVQYSMLLAFNKKLRGLAEGIQLKVEVLQEAIARIR